ncbi:MAG TPA: nucleoid-associated protein [Perlabentimonas sp.]|nr:nucleoid-associated protein [Perlabentimonas sp.]
MIKPVRGVEFIEEQQNVHVSQILPLHLQKKYMFDFTEAKIAAMAIHRVGSTVRENELVLANELVHISDSDLLELLKNFFVSPFKQPEFYSFSHNADVEENLVYNFSSNLFSSQENLLEQSRNIANHLYRCSTHPNIKDGELYVILMSDCVIEGELVDAVGIFKSETKDTFIKVYENQSKFEVEQHKGINIKKIDKGCLVFNTERDFGYKIVAIDNSSKSDDAKFWKESFLNIKPREDDFYQTSGYINLCKDFVKEVLKDDNTVDRTEQVDMLNKSRDYFTQNEAFNQVEFEEEIIKKPEVVEQFREYKDSYQAELGCNLKDSFTISVNAAKKAKKVFKSVIKLDKNFHLYIHGGRNRVEKGFDHDKGLNYYTLFFDAES